MSIKSLAVYLGSSTSNSEELIRGVELFGEEMLRRNIQLIYGGASVGLMGILANTILKGGGTVIGVIPRFVEWKELKHTGLTELIEVNSMGQRKDIMAAKSDACVALPGGVGTFDEIFEYITYTQLKLHQPNVFKPVGLYSVAKFYEDTMNQLVKFRSYELMSQETLDIIRISDDPAVLIDSLELAINAHV